MNLLQRLWHSWCSDVSEIGRALILGGLVALMIGSSSTNIDTYLMVGFLACFGIAAIILVFIFRSNLEIRTTLPNRVVAGQSFPFLVTVSNCTNKTVYDVLLHSVDPRDQIEFSPKEQTIPVLSAHSEVSFSFQVHFSKRGLIYFSGFWADTTFPFGWLRMGYYHDPCANNIIVYPNFTPLQEFQIPTGRKYQPGGIAYASRLSDSTEYMGNREYHPGDRLREIDWHSWARLGMPVVREYQEEYFCRLALVIDTQLINKSSSHLNDFEAMLSLGAAIADYLSRQEYLLDIFAAGPQVYILEAGRSLAHFENVLEVLACLEPCEKNFLENVTPILEERSEIFTTIILLLLNTTPEILQFIEKWSQLGIGVKVILCHSQPNQKYWPNSHPYINFQCFSAEEIQAGLSTI